MNKLIRTFSFTLLALVLGLCASAQAQGQEQTTEATVTRLEGSATFKVGNGAAQAISVGTKIPQGAEVSTQANSRLTIQAHDGIVAVAGEKTTVQVEKLSVSADGMRNAIIDLKSGQLASSLDPARKNQNNYSVRTPKGVAAARGTTYSVAYDGVIYSVTVVAGVVQSFSASGIGTDVTVGQVASDSGSGATTQTLADAVANNPSMADGLALLAASVASVSTSVNDVAAVINTIASSAGTGEAATKAVASATAAAAATAAINPNISGSSAGAADVASAIVGAAVSGSATAGNSASAGSIVATTTVAVARTTGTPVATLAATLTQTANNTAGLSINATSVANAAQASIDAGNEAVMTTSIMEVASPTGEANIVETPIVTPPMTVDLPPVSPSGAGL